MLVTLFDELQLSQQQNVPSACIDRTGDVGRTLQVYLTALSFDDATLKKCLAVFEQNKSLKNTPTYWTEIMEGCGFDRVASALSAALASNTFPSMLAEPDTADKHDAALIQRAFQRLQQFITDSLPAYPSTLEEDEQHASAAELASSYAPELSMVGTYAGAPPANLKELFPDADGSALVGVVGYALNSLMAAYPEAADTIRSTMTPRGLAMLESVSRQCVGQTAIDFAFRHLQPYFTEDVTRLINTDPLSDLLDAQRIGRYKPNAPVLIDSNRYDPLVPWTGANQLGRDWCAQGGDVDFQSMPPYEIPYRCLLPQGVEQLLVAGRCISADHEAHARSRNMPACMATGQAAGVAAAIAVEEGVSVRQVPIAKVQAALRELGMPLHAEEVPA
jgi:hypothetical protein